MSSTSAVKRVVVVWNEKAANSTPPEGIRGLLRPLEERWHHVELHETMSPDEAVTVAADAPDDALVIAAGGDGTVHMVAQGLIQRNLAESPASVPEGTSPGAPILGVIPLGTANDFARSLGMPLDPSQAAAALCRASSRVVDVLRVSFDGREQWMINAAGGANAAEVSRRIDSDQKRDWGPWCYVRGVVEVVADLDSYPLRLWLDDQPMIEMESFVIVVANGRTIGTLEMASGADLEDAQFELIVVKEGPLIDTANVAAGFFTSEYLNNEQVFFRRARSLRIKCDRRIGFSIDGELQWGNAIHFTVQPRALPTIVGPEYRPGQRSPVD